MFYIINYAVLRFIVDIQFDFPLIKKVWKFSSKLPAQKFDEDAGCFSYMQCIIALVYLVKAIEYQSLFKDVEIDLKKSTK